MKVDYSKTFIYKLCCKDINIKAIYVGHSTDYKSRNQQHKTSSNNPNSKGYNNYKYQFIRDNGGYDNWNMIIIKDYPCNNKREAEAEENRIMIDLGATLNSYKSYRTEEEKKEQNKKCCKNYREQNKDEIKKKSKKYREDNKEEILEKAKIYYEQNKDIINEKNKKNYQENKDKKLEKQKEYREKNKNQLNGKQKQYYQENKDKINEKKKEYYKNNKNEINKKITCDKCGTTITKNSLKRHQKRDICIKKSECILLD